MSDFMDLNEQENELQRLERELEIPVLPEINVVSYTELEKQLAEASLLVDDIVLKNYLAKLSDLEIVPLPAEMKQIGDIRLFKITEMVYQ